MLLTGDFLFLLHEYREYSMATIGLPVQGGKYTEWPVFDSCSLTGDLLFLLHECLLLGHTAEPAAVTQRFHSGYTAVTHLQWLHSGYTAVTQRLHSGYKAVTHLRRRDPFGRGTREQWG